MMFCENLALNSVHNEGYLKSNLYFVIFHIFFEVEIFSMRNKCFHFSALYPFILHLIEDHLYKQPKYQI